MTSIGTYPRIRSVEPKCDKSLLVTFDNGEQRMYDCTPLLDSEVFRPLQDEAFFRCAHVDSHGYGVVWSDEIDLAESEIWLNGCPAEQGHAADRASRGH